MMVRLEKYKRYGYLEDESVHLLVLVLKGKTTMTVPAAEMFGSAACLGWEGYPR